MTPSHHEAAVPADLAPERVLYTAEARRRGFRNALAFRRWCQRHGVPLVADGRMRWVRPADVDHALAALDVAPPPVVASDVECAVARFIGHNARGQG